MLQKSDYDDDKLELGDPELGEWSPEAVELSAIIKQLGVIPDLSVEEYILNFFKSLSI